MIIPRIFAISTTQCVMRGKILSRYSHTFGAFKALRACSKSMKTRVRIMTTTIATCGGLLYFLDNSVKASGIEMRPPKYPWAFKGLFTSLDHAAIRRGWMVYKTVCATCHSLKFLTFGDMVNVCLSETEAKRTAQEYEIDDGPDEEGNYFKRPGKLHDAIPPTFPNEEAARAANNGAYPMDLSLAVRSRKGEHDYIFSLLTGFTDPPAGVQLMDGQFFNTYFPGGAIGMAQMLQDGIVDYDDGTPATQSQMAKDVVEFLTWVCDREWDIRKLYLLKSMGIFAILLPAYWIFYKQRWSTVKSMKIFFTSKQKC